MDLFPAMLDWLGVAVPAGIDGEAIWRPGELERRALDLTGLRADAG